jgi:hypothetical protein
MRMVYSTKEKVDVMFGGYFPSTGMSDKTWYYGDLFHSTGNFTSKTIDSAPTGTTVNWVNISVKATLNGGAIELTVSANDDDASWYYVGPDGTILTRYTKLDGQALWSGLDGKRYLRYTLIIHASNPIRSPVVDKITVLFNRLPLPPVLEEPSHFAYVTIDRPAFNLSSKELDQKDKLRFSIELSVDNFNTVLKAYDQTQAQGGWSAQDYGSGLAALFTIPTGEELVNGRTYQWRARAYDGRDWSAYSVVWWFTVDTTPPEAPYSVSDGLGNDIAFTGSMNALSAHWDSAGDPESGIKAYWYAIGTTIGGTDVKDYTDNGIRTAVTVTGLSLAQGETYYFSVKAENGAGLFSPAVASNGQTVDTTVPTTPVVKDEGDYTNRISELSAQWFSTDSESGIVANKYAIGTESGGTDVVNWTSIGGANAITHSGLNLTEGATYYISVRSTNQVGDWSGIGSSDGITVDVSAPYDLSLGISGHTGSTNRTVVPLKVSAKDKISGLGEMQFSNDGTTWSGWVPYAGTKDWSLSPGDGPKTVYMQVRDRAGNMAGGAYVSILLDTTRPAPPTLKIDDGAKTTNSTNVVLKVQAYDATSGIAEMAFSQDGWQWEDWNAFTETTYYTLGGGDGLKQVYVKVRDGAGNEAGPINASIMQDTQPPTAVTIVINDNAAITQITEVRLKISALDATSGPAKMSFSNDKATWSPWEAFSTDKYWQLVPVVGVQTVSVRVMDAAGNAAPLASDSIAYGQNTMYLSVAKPTNKAKVTGVVKVAGSAISDTPVTSVQVRMDGGVWKDATGGRNWTYDLDTRDYPDGVHVLEVRALNNLGYTVSDPVEVKVANKEATGFGSAAEIGGLVLLIFAILVFSLAVGFVIGRKPGKPLPDEELLDEEAGSYPEEKVPSRKPVVKAPTRQPVAKAKAKDEEE